MKRSSHSTRQPAGAPRPRPIPHPGAYLLKPGYLDFSTESALPFLSPDDARPGEYLWEGPFPEVDDDLEMTKASTFGKRAAAAFFLFIQANGLDGLTMSHMAETMAKPGVSRSCSISFWSYLTRLLWLGSHHVTPAQIAADVEAEVEEEVDAD